MSYSQLKFTTIILTPEALEELKMNKILGCPFCGGEAYHCTDNNCGEGLIGCDSCEVQPSIYYNRGHSEDRDRVIGLWNKRFNHEINQSN